MKTVSLVGKRSAGRLVRIDDGDCELVGAHRWRASSQPQRPYAITTLIRDGRYTTMAMHQLITGWPYVDHIDHDGLNNQRSNLRPATVAQNTQNARPQAGSSSRFKGVTWHKGAGKWQVMISGAGRLRYLGLFADEEEAARAYDAAARETYGLYAYLNFQEAL